MEATRLEPLTLTVEEAAAMIGVGRTLAFETVRTTGAIAGVPVLRVGRRVLVPRAPLERVLSEGVPPTTDNPAGRATAA
jgi:hypothetical protein